MESIAVGCVILFLLFLWILHWYLTRPYSYWKKRGVPSVPALPIIGSLTENFTKPLPEVLLERYRKYGRVYGYYEMTKPVLSVGEPDLLKGILIKDFNVFTDRRETKLGDPMVDKMVSALSGEEWKRVRTIITPAFSSGKIKKMSSVMMESARVTAKNIELVARSKKPADVRKLLGAFTLDVIARSAFGTVLDSHNDPDNEFVRCIRNAFPSSMSLKFLVFFVCPSILKLFGTSLFSSEATVFFRKVTLKIIRERRESGKRNNDFLQLLLDANEEIERDTAGSSSDQQRQHEDDDAEKNIMDFGHDQENRQVFESRKNYKSLSNDELIAQCILFFLAGHDTTATALSFAVYLLAVNPECQDKLSEEVDEVLLRNKGEFTYEALQGMKYLENVIWETLRLYPSGLSIERAAAVDYKLGDTGITLPKGMVIHIPIFAMHRDPEFYAEPERFNPDRFCSEAKAVRNPLAYLPFGAGPRNCIGMRFALIEMKFCLAVLLSRFRFKRCAETKVPPEFHISQVLLLRPKEIMLSIEERSDNVTKP